MILAAIGTFFVSLLTNIILFRVGEILCAPLELRRFLGLSSPDEDLSRIQNIAMLVLKVGQLVQVFAIVSTIASLVTTIVILAD